MSVSVSFKMWIIVVIYFMKFKGSIAFEIVDDPVNLFRALNRCQLAQPMFHFENNTFKLTPVESLDLLKDTEYWLGYTATEVAYLYLGCFAHRDLPDTNVKSKTTVALNKVQECAKICFESSYIGMTKVANMAVQYYCYCFNDMINQSYGKTSTCTVECGPYVCGSPNGEAISVYRRLDSELRFSASLHPRCLLMVPGGGNNELKWKDCKEFYPELCQPMKETHPDSVMSWQWNTNAIECLNKGRYPASYNYSKHVDISISGSPRWTGITSFPIFRRFGPTGNTPSAFSWGVYINNDELFVTREFVLKRRYICQKGTNVNTPVSSNKQTTSGTAANTFLPITQTTASIAIDKQTTETSGSSTGLAVGLTIPVIITGVIVIIVWKRNSLLRVFRKKEQTSQSFDQPIDGAQFTNTSLNHNYFILEKHTKENDDNVKHQPENDQEHYALPKDSTYEATYAKQEDDYDTTDQGKHSAVKACKPGNVYNTFNDFNEHDEYDHLGDKTKPPRVTENEYNTTQDAMSTAIDDDTYNHLSDGRKPAACPDNVYGMPRVDNDYDQTPPVGGTKATPGIQGDDNYSKIGRFQ